MSAYRKRAVIVPTLLVLISGYILLQSYEYFTASLGQSHIYLRQKAHPLDPSSVQRAVLVFYPTNQESHYLPELRWLYRSWIEMMQYESKHWRTDLLIYTGAFSASFEKLDCLLNQIRLNRTEPPRCRVFLYLRVSDRHLAPFSQRQTSLIDQTRPYLFQIDSQRSISLYNHMRTYGYIDSVNIIAESYPTYAQYDFILKTDIDVFLTKPFSAYLPRASASLLVGLGGYSTQFNTRRLGRIAHDMGWKYQEMPNIGSTWYGSPYVAQRIANLTLDAMLHLNTHEFSRPEREQKIGVLLWPDWHYGVLSMYGTHLAVNHLLVSEKLDIGKADQLLDQSTTNMDEHDLEKHNRLHLHCWHTHHQFSKFDFKADKYNHIHPRTLVNNRSAQAYALRMALESRLLTLEELGQRVQAIGVNKTR